MGGACSTSEVTAEESLSFQDPNKERKHAVLPGNHFPEQATASKQEVLNQPSAQAALKYKAAGDYSIRHVPATEQNPIGGVYRYSDGSTYKG